MKIVAGIEDFLFSTKNCRFWMPITLWSEIHRAIARKSIPSVRKLAADHGWSKLTASGGHGWVIVKWRRLLPRKVTRDAFWYLIDRSKGVETCSWPSYCWQNAVGVFCRLWRFGDDLRLMFPLLCTFQLLNTCVRTDSLLNRTTIFQTWDSIKAVY